MDRKIKKIVAREGLIFIAIVIIGVFAEQIFWMWCKRDIRCLYPEGVVFALCYVVPLLYGAYALPRFVIWAIRTLREK